MNDQYLGMILLSGMNFSPRDQAYCSGQVTPIAKNQALFSLIGTYFGGDGRTTFALPDLRGQVPVGSDKMGTPTGGLNSYPLGTNIGAQYHVLTDKQLPQHTHVATFSSSGSSASSANFYATTKNADETKPNNSYYLATSVDGFNPGDDIYSTKGSDKVALGGLEVEFPTSGEGIVSVFPNGGSLDFSIEQPITAVNYIITVMGLYPTRN